MYVLIPIAYTYILAHSPNSYYNIHHNYYDYNNLFIFYFYIFIFYFFIIFLYLFYFNFLGNLWE